MGTRHKISSQRLLSRKILFLSDLPPEKMRNLQEFDPIVHYNPARQRSVAATTSQGPLLLDGLLGAEIPSLLKIKNLLKSSLGVNVKVHISHQKSFVRICSFKDLGSFI